MGDAARASRQARSRDLVWRDRVRGRICGPQEGAARPLDYAALWNPRASVGGLRSILRVPGAELAGRPPILLQRPGQEPGSRLGVVRALLQALDLPGAAPPVWQRGRRARAQERNDGRHRMGAVQDMRPVLAADRVPCRGHRRQGLARRRATRRRLRAGRCCLHLRRLRRARGRHGRLPAEHRHLHLRHRGQISLPRHSQLHASLGERQVQFPDSGPDAACPTTVRS
mmetsp:Transcript_71089/g.230788  ORF Transcript_71089/g.230788 Transcript_71089/m.230788 type:complete len:227 (-) Transcript_71089:3504-4184(-)